MELISILLGFVICLCYFFPVLKIGTLLDIVSFEIALLATDMFEIDYCRLIVSFILNAIFFLNIFKKIIFL